MSEILFYRETPGLVVAVKPALATADADPVVAIVGILRDGSEPQPIPADCALAVWATYDRILNLVGSPEAAARLQTVLGQPVRVANAILVRQIAQEIIKIDMNKDSAKLLIKSCIIKLIFEIEAEIHLDKEERNSKFIYMTIIEDPIAAPSIDDLAKGLGISLWKINDDFKKIYGKTINTFLFEKRMEWAYQKITQSSMLIKEISEAIGYQSTSNFSTAFSRYFDVSPRRLRLSATENKFPTRDEGEDFGGNDE